MLDLRPEDSRANQAEWREKSFPGGKNCLCKGPEAEGAQSIPETEATSVAGRRLETQQGLPQGWWATGSTQESKAKAVSGVSRSEKYT